MSTLDELHSLAERGDSEAQYQLGVYYTHKEQLSDAVKYFNKAAKQGNYLAKLHLAKLHTHSKNQFKSAEPYIALELYEEIVRENPDDLQVKFKLGVMYCTAGAGFMGYGEGYILRDGNRMKRNLKEGRKLIEYVLDNVDPDSLPYSDISTLGTLYGDGWLRDKRKPTINDMIQGIKYRNRAIELATELVDTNILYKDLIELGKKSIDAVKGRMKADLNVWRCDHIIITTAGGTGVSYGDETFFDDVGFDDNAILEKLKKSGFDDIADKLKQEWCEENEKESSEIEQSEDNANATNSCYPVSDPPPTPPEPPSLPEPDNQLRNIFLVLGVILIVTLIMYFALRNNDTNNGTQTVVSQNQNDTVYAYVNTDKLNVRSGPGTNYSVVKTLSYGQRVEIIGNPSDFWVRCDQCGAGYISSQYLSSNNPHSLRE